MTRFFASRAGGQVLFVVVLAVCAVLLFVNLAGSPDLISDENTYALTGQDVIRYNSLTFGSTPIVVHPPLFFLTSGAWLWLTGHVDSTIESAVTSLRYLEGIFDLGIVLISAALGRVWLRNDVRVNPAFIAPATMILIGTDGFLLRFGRAVLIEPMSVFFGMLALLVAWALRHARLPYYVAGTGIAMAVALLCKQPALFLVAAPLVASLLRLSLRDIGRQLLTLLTALFVFSSFAVWAYQTGNGTAFYNTQTLNIRRLLGLAQVTGLNKTSSSGGAGALTAIKETFAIFAGAYILFFAGAIALVVLAWQLVRERRRDALSEGKTQLLALGLISYAFLAYSVLFGQSNQQLTVYTVPAAAILTVWLVLGGNPLKQAKRAGTIVRRAAGGVAAIGLVVSLVSGFAFFPLRNDNATVRVASYLRDNVQPCAPVNLSGNGTHWSFIMRNNPVRAFRDGPAALRAGVHLFLVSPRDALFGYGNSSPELNKWVMSNGRRLFQARTNVYTSVGIWQVGSVPKPVDDDPQSCVPKLKSPRASEPSPALRYLGFVGAAVAIVVILAGGSAVGSAVMRRRRGGHRPAHAAEPSD